MVPLLWQLIKLKARKSNMNKVILLGRLVRDPELRFIPSGQAVCNFTLAIDRPLSKEKKAELQAKVQATADFPRIIVWGKLAELCANYLSKGKQVALEGTLQTSTYKTNTGETRYSTDVVASHVEFIGGSNDKPKSEGGDDFNFGYNTDDFQAIKDDEDIPF
jgi:single-strand DNA-binding protein